MLKMRWITVTFFTLVAIGCLAKEDEDSNEVSVSPQQKNLDANLRRALLEALTELEKEDSGKFKTTESEDKIIEKASASAVSIFANSESVSTAPATTTEPEPPQETKKPIIVVQKSQGIEHSPITTVEKEDLDPFNDAEQILTSASSSFTLPSSQSLSKPDLDNRNSNKVNANLIKDTQKFSTKINHIDTTTPITLSSTEENEAKVEDVQFFSAPLVAAFTVHQDEQGVPKKVEPIYKPILTKEQKEEIKLRQQAKLKEDELKRDQEKKQQQIAIQLEIQQKHEALEQEIARLHLSLKQQQQLNQQQQDLLLKQQQEQFRLRNNNQPFRPIVNPSIVQFTTPLPVLNQNQIINTNFESFSTEKPALNQFNPTVSSINQQLPIKPAILFNENGSNSRGSISLLPSITYDPLTEAGKLPVNGQILPVKGPINFHSPVIQTAGFQQFHSLPQINPTNTPLISSFNQLYNVQPQFVLGGNQRNRFFRHETGVGNFVNNNVNTVSPSFSIQKSVQPTDQHNFSKNFNSFSTLPQQNNRFFRSNAASAVFPTQNHQQPQTNRFFRSNLESTFRSPNNYDQSHLNNYHLRNLLYNSGAFREKSPVDINIISKVLSYNYSDDSQFGNSRRRDLFIKDV